MRLEELGEFGLIERIRERVCAPSGPPARALVGIGEDCAVFGTGSRDTCGLLTVDSLVEGVHYLPSAPPQAIGRKLLGCSLSDIAAMGGVPLYALVCLSLPPAAEVSLVDGLYEGITLLAAEFGVEVVGGDTVRTAGPPVLSCTLYGEVERKRLLLRSGARPGDLLFVTGTLGGAQRGRHLLFTPRIREARLLTERFPVSAMIDLSDGLASDLHRLASSSGVGAKVFEGLVPVSDAAAAAAGESGRRPLDHALFDGEDFELLFSVPQRYGHAAAALVRKTLETHVEHIGEVTDIRGSVILLDEYQHVHTLSPGGFDHFRGGS